MYSCVTVLLLLLSLCASVIPSTRACWGSERSASTSSDRLLPLEYLCAVMFTRTCVCARFVTVRERAFCIGKYQKFYLFLIHYQRVQGVIILLPIPPCPCSPSPSFHRKQCLVKMQVPQTLLEHPSPLLIQTHAPTPTFVLLHPELIRTLHEQLPFAGPAEQRCVR